MGGDARGRVGACMGGGVWAGACMGRVCVGESHFFARRSSRVGVSQRGVVESFRCEQMVREPRWLFNACACRPAAPVKLE